MNDSKRAPDWLAIAGIALTLTIHLALVATKRAPSAVFIGVACLAWAVYLVIRFLQSPGILQHWGFRVDNLRQASFLPVCFLGAGVIAFAAYAWTQGYLRFPWQTWILLLIYPIWGIVQQFLALGIVLNNLERVPWLGERPALAGLMCATMFGLIHIYNTNLALATFVLEIGLIAHYRRYRNLWPLGFLHGWLGGLFYLWVLNEDLWTEIFPN
jgi:CAAX prenyl protease-like protein